MQDRIFSPSFGNRPRTLVGRDDVIQQFLWGLQSRPGSRERAILMLGQRGSGKTVLLLEMADLAREQGYLVASPTVAARGMLERILEKLSDAGREFLPKKNLNLSGGSVGAFGFSAGVQLDVPDTENKSFAYRLSELCRQAGKAGQGVLILVDEVQANSEELRQLIIAYQEMVGEGQDIAMVLAGLPAAIASALNDHVLTFLNRASRIALNALSFRAIEAYYQKSFRELGVDLSEEGRSEAAAFTMGSPYLMQLVGHYITLFADESGRIDRALLQGALRAAKEDFTRDICETTLAPLSDADIRFLEAMSEDSEVSSISEIAGRLGVTGAYVQTYKRRLIQAGVIESPRRGTVKYAVPYLREYLRERE